MLHEGNSNTIRRLHLFLIRYKQATEKLKKKYGSKFEKNNVYALPKKFKQTQIIRFTDH